MLHSFLERAALRLPDSLQELIFYFSRCIFQLPSRSLLLVPPRSIDTAPNCFVVSLSLSLSCQSFFCIIFLPVLSSSIILCVVILLISILHSLYFHPVLAEGGEWPLTAALMEVCVCVGVLRGVIRSDSDRVDKVTSR